MYLYVYAIDLSLCFTLTHDIKTFACYQKKTQKNSRMFKMPENTWKLNSQCLCKRKMIYNSKQLLWQRKINKASYDLHINHFKCFQKKP